MTELSDEEIITLIKTEMAKVDRDRVYWVLRDMKIKEIFDTIGFLLDDKLNSKKEIGFKITKHK